jgi:hypothetical protein
MVIDVSYGNYIQLTSRGVLLTPEARGWGEVMSPSLQLEQVLIASSLALSRPLN